MPAPTDLDGLRRFFGMLNYVSKFMPKLSDIAEPLRPLLSKEIVWDWTAEHNKCFEKLKSVLCQAPILAYYDEKKKN